MKALILSVIAALALSTAMAQTQITIDDTTLGALVYTPPQVILAMLGQPTEISDGPPMLQYQWHYKNNGSPLFVTIQDGKVEHVTLATYDMLP
jgi:hypothetical protein